MSEHQPTAWPAFFFDLQMLIYLFPAGVYLCFRQLRDEHVFVIVYALVGSYFAGVMVRLMLTLTPIVCVAGAIVIDRIFRMYLDPYVDPESVMPIDAAEEVPAAAPVPAQTPSSKSKRKPVAPVVEGRKPIAPAESVVTHVAAKANNVYGLDTRAVILAVTTFFLVTFCLHCTWVTSTAYSSPSVVLASRGANGEQNIIDDFREAYYWIRQNTDKDAKVMSWWDYGYQLAGFADRTTLVDNATWNNTQ